ncbi:MAG: AAA family ATPase [Phycisphaerales bacterium]|nr:AAA family ATPase [Phycisphaerales bacterium]
MYLDFFGLNEPPFNNTPAPRFLYPARGHAAALRHLVYGVEHRRGFILLTGDIGSGKTTLCRALLEQLRGRCRTALILNPALSESQLLRAIVHELGLKPPRGDRLALREALTACLLEEAAAGRDVVLIIDEAQHLNCRLLEQIRLLSNLETDDRKLLQIVLAGQPELADRLADPRLRQLRQRVTVRFHLGPIGADETEAYIRHRIHVAGGNGRPGFAPEAVRDIHENARGLPRLLNALCDMSLLAAFGRGEECVGIEHVRDGVEELKGCLT